MTSIRMLTLEELWKSLEDREQKNEIAKICLKKDGKGNSLNSYYSVPEYNEITIEQDVTITLKELTTALYIEAPKRNLNGVPILIWLVGKKMFIWIKERLEYFYQVLEIVTPKKGNSILKLEDLYNKGRVFYMKIPQNWEILNDELGLIRDG